MIRALFDTLSRFFAGLAASLTGLGALCTAVGFVAERDRLRLLGLDSTPVDLDQYLVTGATLLARMPAAFVIGLAELRLPVEVVLSLALAAAAWAFVRASTRPPVVAARTWISGPGAWTLLLALLGAQLLLIPTLTGVGGVSDLLFDTARGATTELGSSLRASDRTASLGDLLGRTLAGALGTVLLLAYAIPGRRRPPDPAIPDGAEVAGMVVVVPAAAAPPTPRRGLAYRALFAANLLLLMVQAYLVPVNYGAALLGYRFPLACVEAGSFRSGAAPDRAAFLVHSEPSRILLFTARDRQLWHVERGAVERLSFVGSADIVDATWGDGTPACPPPVPER